MAVTSTNSDICIQKKQKANQNEYVSNCLLNKSAVEAEATVDESEFHEEIVEGKKD